MDAFERFKLKVKRGETPLDRALRAIARFLLYGQGNLPVPSFMRPLFRGLYELHFLCIIVARRLLVCLYREPLFRSRCTSVGKNLQLPYLPYVSGHAEIHIGDDVTFTGHLSIFSGRFLDRPRLIIKDHASIGGGTVISVNKEVIIEEYALVSTDCRISDNDGHPREADLRAASAPVSERDIRPVRIGRHAWIGNGSQIMKGVTIGEGAIIGAHSVVISNIPRYCIAMGNPAEIYFRNVGKPAVKSAAAT